MQTAGIAAIFKAVDVAADLRKLALALAGAMAIVIGAGIFILLAILIDLGGSITDIVLLILAFIAGWVLFALFSGALTYMSWQELANGLQIRAVEALSFSGKNILSLLFSPIALLILGIAILVVELALLLLGRIPVAGEIILALLYLPLVIVNILLFVGIAAGSWLVFPIIAASGAGVLDTLQKVLAIIRKSPVRLFVIFTLALIVVLFTLVILWFLLSLGVSMTLGLMGVSAGADTLTDMANIQFLQPLIESALSFPVGILGFFELTVSEPTLSMQIASIITAISVLLLTVGAVVVFPWVFALAVSCAIYQIMGEMVPKPAAQPGSPQPLAHAGPVIQQPVAARNCKACRREIKTSSHFCPFCGTDQR